MQACGIARGTWQSDGCLLDIGESMPSYCDWVPFASALFANCKVPNVSDLVNYGSYTAYMTGQVDSLDAARAMMQQNVQQSQGLYDSTDCAYKAASNFPVLSQIVGPALACGITDPFGSLREGGYAWAIYIAIGLGVYALAKR